MSVGYKPRQESLGPWIVAAAIAHAIFLAIAFVCAIEYEKMVVRDTINQMQQQRQSR